MNISKIAVMAIAAFAVSTMTSCSGSANKDAQATDSVAHAESVVIELANDDQYRPGKAIDKPAILDFNAVWCGPCKAFRPTFDKFAEQYASEYDFVSVDIDKCPETGKAFGAERIPHVVAIDKDGKVTVLEVATFEQFFNK